MTSRRFRGAGKGVVAFLALAVIVLAYRAWLHVIPTTVALTLLLYILLVAARLGLRYAIAISFAATICYNFFFLPPVGTFTIADPQNWLALFVFLATGVIGSRLSQQARDEARRARVREREVDLLFSLSRELLQIDNVAEMVSRLPQIVQSVSGSSFVVLYLLADDRLYRAGVEPVGAHLELEQLRQLALNLQAGKVGSGDTHPSRASEFLRDGAIRIPLRAGVRPRGLLIAADLRLSDESYSAMGGLVSIAIDRAQALESVARADATKESERLRTLMLDTLTHELRTPLTSIKGAASALLHNESVSLEDRLELLTIVDEEADRLNRLVGQAVEMAQIEAREVRMNFAPVAMQELMEQAKSACAWVASSHPITVDLPALPVVMADGEMIVKVLCNLLENAAKYSTPDSPILVSAEERGGMVFTSVADKGAGIDPAEQALIFDRLYRSRTRSRAVSGTGMGLAISRSIVESHAGTLTVASRVNHGSVFTFSLPAVVVP